MSVFQGMCSKSELDYFTVPPTQSVILDDYVIESRPTDPKSNTLEFIFPSSSDDFSDLSQCFFKLDLKVTKANGSAPVHYGPLNTTTGNEPDGDDIDGVPVSLILHSIFKQLQLFLNDELVSSELDYGYKAYLTSLFSYSKEVKDTFLFDLEGYRTDEESKFDNSKQKGVIKTAKKLCKNGRTFQLKGRPYTELCMQSRLIPSNVKFRFVFTRASDAFCMMSHNEEKYKIVIDKAVMSLRRVKIDPEVQMKIEKQIAQSGAIFPSQSVVCKTFTIPQGLTDYTIASLFANSEIPSRLLIGQLDNKSYTGDYTLNPFHFKHKNLSYCGVTIGGQTFSYDFDFSAKNKVDAYLNLHQIMGNYPCDYSNGISKSLWESGLTLIAFDLCPDQSHHGDFVSKRREGSISLKLKWDSGLAENTSLLVIGMFDNSYIMGINRNFTRTVVH